jgi:outer membrane immunogenic protein
VRLTLVSTILLSVLVIPAHGGELEGSSAYDWTGFYAGVSGGYGMGSSTTVGVPSGSSQTIGLSGGLLGANAGYNAQMDNFVLGVEGDVSWSGISGSAICTLDPSFTCRGDIDWIASITGRAGVAFDKALLYASGGVALSGVEARVTPSSPFFTGSHSGIGVGWTAGVGVEVAVTENVSLKADFSHVNFGTVRAPAGTLSSNGDVYDLSASANIVKVGVNFAF